MRCLACLISIVILSAALRAQADEPLRFNRDIRPILSNFCFPCHGPDGGQRKADLRLDLSGGLFETTASDVRPVIPGKPEESELVLRVESQDVSERMPPAAFGKALTEKQIGLLKRWITEGAKWEAHWSLQPVTRPPLPESGTALHPIDRFLARELRRENLSFSPEAYRVTLLRRVSFDLTGLPPTRNEVETFLRDTRPDNYEQLVDRLLASPHFGERLASWWLDLVRYADTVGYHGDQERPIAAYRDYVIDSFNADLPFDQFTAEQLAGDLLPNPTTAQRIASGYNMLGMTTIEGGAQPGEYLAKYAADRVRNASSVWMGATLGCAECHDHKYDPYTTREFYEFAAFFADVREKGVYDPVADLLLPTPAQAARLAETDKQISVLKSQAGTAAMNADIKALKAERAAVEKTVRRTIQTVNVPPRQFRVLPRGNWLDETGEVVEPAVPVCLPEAASTGARLTRLDLARWLTSREHPQTARVVVNRLWKLCFGTGLSRSLDDLGVQGEWPRHAELLDWLAADFMESGWRIKPLLRQLVLSRAYRQSSQMTAPLRQADPLNRLVARQSAIRLDAEMIRDQALQVSGLLVHTIGGDSVRPYQPAGYYQQLNFPQRDYVADTGEKQHRRGLYTHWQRTYLHPMLLAFDAPSREECTAERPVSNTPQQSLVLLNDPSFVEASQAFAARILSEGGDSTADRIHWAWTCATSRPPTDDETAILSNLLTREQEALRLEPQQARARLVFSHTFKTDAEISECAAWMSVSRTLLNLGETLLRP